MDKTDNIVPLKRSSTLVDEQPAAVGPESIETRLAEAEQLIARAEQAEAVDLGQIDTARIWGVPLACLTYEETLDEVDRLIGRGQPAYFITANLHYAMLADRDRRLQDINERAAFIVADGMPMVWRSRLKGPRLPERVTGSDLIFLLSHRAAERGHRVFLLGGGPGVADKAAENLCQMFPGLEIVGIESPMIDNLSDSAHASLVERIRQARPDLLLIAFGQPKGEKWMAEYCTALGVPACVQLGASFDFAAGRVARAPRWTHKIGAEWLYRIWREPRRMIPRYSADALFLLKAVLRDLFARGEGRGVRD